MLLLLFNLIRVQQAVVDSELHQLGEQVQHLSLQGHRSAGGVLLQSFDHQWLKQTNVVVDGILGKQGGEELQRIKQFDLTEAALDVLIWSCLV